VADESFHALESATMQSSITSLHPQRNITVVPRVQIYEFYFSSKNSRILTSLGMRLAVSVTAAVYSVKRLK